MKNTNLSQRVGTEVVALECPATQSQDLKILRENAIDRKSIR
jgi:hypothetical protein